MFANVCTLLLDMSDLQAPARVLLQKYTEHNVRLRMTPNVNHVELRLKFRLLPPAVQVIHCTTPEGARHTLGNMNDAHPPPPTPSPELYNEMSMPRLHFGISVEPPTYPL